MDFDEKGQPFLFLGLSGTFFCELELPVPPNLSTMTIGKRIQ